MTTIYLGKLSPQAFIKLCVDKKGVLKIVHTRIYPLNRSGQSRIITAAGSLSFLGQVREEPEQNWGV